MKQQYWRINLVLCWGDPPWKLFSYLDAYWKNIEWLVKIFIWCLLIYRKHMKWSIKGLCGGFWKRKRVFLKYIKLIKDLYDESVASMRWRHHKWVSYHDRLASRIHIKPISLCISNEWAHWISSRGSPLVYAVCRWYSFSGSK